MSLFKSKRFWVPALLIAAALGFFGVIVYRSRLPQVPIKIYKVAKPAGHAISSEKVLQVSTSTEQVGTEERRQLTEFIEINHDVQIVPEEIKALPMDEQVPFKDTVPEETNDIPVSPYGFGPYPELPEEWAGAFPPKSIKHELMVRVAVKLREEGVNVEGISMWDGRVYPVIKGIRYVKWAETDEGVRYITRASGHPDDGARLHAIREKKEKPFVTEGDIPLDIKLVPYEEGGINPYEFLGFHR